MELATQTVPIGVTSSRPLATYQPSVWGDRFLLHKAEPNEARAKQLVEKLKEEVKRELKKASNDYMRLLKMVDAIQRLGIEYQFKEEVDEALQNMSENFDDYICKDNNDMYTIALSFRLLRQHGYRVSCHIFDRFKDEVSSVNPDAGKATGMLEYFEATHLRVHGEETLDRGSISSRKFLESVLPSLSNPVAEQVRHALYQNSNRRGLTRVEARHYISIYEQYPSHHEGLLKLAKLDFNLLQSMHRRELSELSRWWKTLEVPNKLSYARDRLVETYFWDSGVYFEPEYAVARKFLVKLQCLMSILDDTFDAYGTYEELSLFTEAIERWNMSCLDHLPDYMKIIYKTLLDVFEEIEEHTIKQGTSYRLNYGIESVKIMVRAFLKEAKWREEKYKPTSEEYMQIATYSCGYTTLIIMSFLGMGDIVTKEAFDWVLSKPDAVRATLIICRLVDDIVGYEFEKGREHIPTAVDCYMEEHKVSMEETINEFSNRLESAWKDLNEVFMKPTKFPTSILYRILNFARVIEVMYTKGDWYTHVGPEMQSFISQLFVDPVPIPEY